MKKIIYISFGLLILGLQVDASPVDSLFYGAFGNVTIYHPG